MPNAPGLSFDQRYLTIKRLRDEHGIETVLARDLAQGDEVVVKAAAIGALTASAIRRMEREAQRLRDLGLGVLAPIREVERHNGRLYLVSPFVPGASLRARLEGGPLSVAESLVVGRCVLEALRTAHALGVLHLHVKPADIIVDDSSPVRRATLIDFGLARGRQPDPYLSSNSIEAALYLSPEQAGALDHEVDDRSDLYAAGVVLFECLAGRPPFLGQTVGELIRQHVTAPAPSLRSLGRTVPRALDQIVLRLLRKDPQDRYQSASAVLADLAELVRALEQGVRDPDIAVGAHDRRRTLTAPAFIGRTDEIEALQTELVLAQGGHSRLVFVESESGGGKTCLLEELALMAIRQGARLFRGQGVALAAQRPFQVLDDVVSGLLASTHVEPQLIPRLHHRLADSGVRAAVCTAMPQLSDLLQPDGWATPGPEAYGETRSLAALTRLIEALGEPGRPLVVLLDDCQWADEQTIKLLASWQQQARVTNGGHVLIVAAFRSEEVAAGHPLRALQPTLHLRLSPFGQEELRRLIQSMAGPAPDEAYDLVARLSGGSPFMAVALVRGLVESGAMVAEAESAELWPERPIWRLTPRALSDAQPSRLAATFLAHRLDMLPAETLYLLSVGAVLGKTFDLPLAAALAGQTTEEGARAIGIARQRHLVWMAASGRSCTFLHDKLREALLARLRDTERRQLHHRAALCIEGVSPDRAFDLAFHFDAAGEYGRALPYALTAAAARARHALENAEHYYRIAERGARSAAPQTRREVAQGLGEVLMLRGRYEEAAQQFLAARMLAEADDVRAQIDGRLGELAFKRGDMTQAIAAIEQALRLLGKHVPRRALALGAGLLWEVGIQALHSLWPRLFVGRRPLEGADRDLLAMRLYSRLGYAYWFQRGRLACLWAHLREMNLAERYPPTPQLAQAYSEHGPAMSMIPWVRRGTAYLERSLALRRTFGDLWGQGQTLHFYGVLLYAASRYAEAIEKCRESVRLLEQTGDPWEGDAAQWHLAFCLYRLGDLRGAADLSQRLYQRCLELGNTQGLATSLEIWALATEGRVPKDILHRELQRPRNDVQATASVLQAEALRLLAEGRPTEAAGVLSRAQDLVRRAGLRNEYVVPIDAWLATAHRREAERVPLSNPRRRKACLQRARAAARRALRLGARFRNSLPHALREAGLLAAAGQRPRWSRRLLDRSLGIARAQGARYEEAQTLLARGLVGLELGWPDATQDLAQAHQLFHSLGADAVPRRRQEDVERGGHSRTATLSLVDRFDAVLDTCRRLASALTRETIFAAVRDAALTLLRTERGAVIEIVHAAGRTEIRTVAGPSDAALNERVAGELLAGQRPVILAHQDGRARDAGLALQDDLAVLCAPIAVRGQVTGGFYVTARRVEGLFGEHEVRLAEYISTLAGTALENAEGFAELQRTHEELRRRADDAALNVEISAAVLRSGDLSAILQHCADILLRHLDAALVRVWTYREGDDALELQASAGTVPCPASAPELSPIHTQEIDRLARSRRPYVTNQVATDPVLRSRSWAEAEGLASFAAYPLTVEDRPVGVMGLFARRALDETTVWKLSLVAEPLAQCLIRKRAEREIRSLNEQLERRVVSRTQELEAAKQTLERDLLQRKRDERRLAAQYAVTRVLAESPTLTDAAPKILAAICESLDWLVGVFWQVDRYAGVIRCTDLSCPPGRRTAEFEALTRTLTFPPGEGLPGRIWAQREPVWLPDVLCDPNYPRAPAAAKAGLHAAFGFPILSRGEVLGVIEFYSDTLQAPDEALLQMMTAIGSQVGQFIERKLAEEALRESEQRYRTVAETAAEAIITIDESSTIVFVNRAAEQIFGYASEELIGQRLTLLMPESLRNVHQQAMGRYLATNRRHLAWERVNLPGRHKSGREIPLELAFWEFTQHGKRFFSSIIRDITERVQAAELRTRLLEQVISAQEEERRRIARELHDETGQALMSLLVGLHTIETSTTLSAARAHAGKFRRIAAQALDEVRRLAIGLRPSALDDLGLAAALERYVVEYTQAYGITVDLHAPGLEQGRLPAPLEITLYRILQEALTNIAKHAGANLVSVVVERHGGAVRAIIEDDGCGFDVDATLQMSRTTKHLGLHSMRERAHLVNGSIAIESTPGRGTSIYVTIPLEESRHGQDQGPDR